MASTRLFATQLTILLRHKCIYHLPKAIVSYQQPHTLVQHSRNYVAKGLCPPKPPKPRKKRNYLKYILVGMLVASAVTVGYAKYDPEFRQKVTEYLPFFDGFVAFIFCEKQSHWASIKEALNIQTSKNCPPAVLPKPKEKKVEKVKKTAVEEKQVVDCRVAPVIEEVTEEEEEIEEVAVVEEKPKEPEPVCILIEKPESLEPDCAQVKTVIEDSTCEHKKHDPEIEKVLKRFNVRDMGELVIFIGCQYESSIKKNIDTSKMYRAYSDAVLKILRCSVNEPIPNLWMKLQERKDENERIFKRLHCEICDHAKNIEALMTLFEEPCIIDNVSKRTIQDIRRKIDKYAQDLEKAHTTYLEDRRWAMAATEFWMKTKEVRDKTAFEFEALVRDLKFLKKTLHNLNESPVLDLWLMEMKQRLMLVMHRIREVQMDHTCILMDARMELANKLHLKTMSAEELTAEAQKRVDQKELDVMVKHNSMTSDVMKELVKKSEDHVQFQACRYGQAMRLRLKQQKKLLTCLLDKEMNEILEKQKATYDSKLEILDEKFSELSTVFGEHAQSEKGSREAQSLWLSVKALHSALHPTCTGNVAPYKQLRSLGAEICAIRQAATENDELVNTVLATLPDEVVFRGIYTEEALKDRFYKLEKVVRDMALIPETGAPLYMYFLSYFQGMLLLKTPEDIPKKELSKDGKDYSKLGTYDIIQRARYFMDRGNYLQALRYMNMLNGAAKCIANDWIKEMKLRLETVQATEVLLTYATSLGVKYLGIVTVDDD